MPCNETLGASSSAPDTTAHALAALYAVLLAGCLALAFVASRRRRGLKPAQGVFVVLLSLMAGVRCLAFLLEPSLYPCEEYWDPRKGGDWGFALLATTPRLLFFCSYSALVYHYQVDHRAADARTNRRVAAALAACNVPGLVAQLAYCSTFIPSLGYAEAEREDVYTVYIHIYAAVSLLLSVCFVAYGVVLYGWYNRTAFFQNERGSESTDFDVFTFIDNHARFKEQKQQVALVSLVCSVSFITKGCLLVGQYHWSLFNRDWLFELLSSTLGDHSPPRFFQLDDLVCAVDAKPLAAGLTQGAAAAAGEIFPAACMLLVLWKPTAGRGGGGGGAGGNAAPSQSGSELQEMLVDSGAG